MFQKLHSVMKLIENSLYDDLRIKDGPHVSEFYHHRFNKDKENMDVNGPIATRLQEHPHARQAYRFSVRVTYQLRTYADTVID